MESLRAATRRSIELGFIPTVRIKLAMASLPSIVGSVAVKLF